MDDKIKIVSKKEDKLLVTRVYINGKEIKDIRKMQYEHDSLSSLPVLTIDVMCSDVLVDSDNAKINIIGGNLESTQENKRLPNEIQRKPFIKSFFVEYVVPVIVSAMTAVIVNLLLLK